MVFSSHIFLFVFLPLFLAGYFALVRMRVGISWLNLFITVSSYAFYGWFEPWFVFLMWVSSLVDYAAGRVISRPDATRKVRNVALTLSMASNLSLLGFFKYFMFAGHTINDILAVFGQGPEFFQVWAITLPIGISFYTFQSMSYTIDVWRGDAPPVKDFRTFSCYVALFPQLIAGPIVRYNTVAEQLAKRRHSLAGFTSGAALFGMGMAKKILVANPAGNIADTVFRAQGADPLSAWWGAVAYTFQIYFDFSAYSDMAVGLGRMLGFEFCQNFNAPYRAQSITDFWKRWHMSLTTWLRDYLYISLGGNRVATKRRLYFNLVVVYFLSGLWHGANWTFIAWGVFHATFMVWERIMDRKPIYAALPLPFRILFTQVIVVFAWVLFRAPDIGQAVHYWGSMLGLTEVSAASPFLHAVAFQPKSLFVMALCLVLVVQPVQAMKWVERLTPLKLVIALFLFAFSVAVMFAQDFNPFLYFQF